jgi:N-formylglutamate amidohydrolase
MRSADDGPAGESLTMDRAFPIVRHPTGGTRIPVLVSVPHYGTQPLPHITRDDYREPWFETFAYGFADTFVGDLYGDLHELGATVLATPFSRMFVDVNRRRDDFEHQDGEVRSRRGVVRTHTMRDAPIFARPLALADLEARLRTLYDPYYSTLEYLLTRLHQEYGYALLLDGHTGSPRRMKAHQVIIGTRHDATCAPQLAATAAAIFTRHGFEVHKDVSGYTGGNIVATYGRPNTRHVHALQLEINASLLMTTTREEFIAQVSRGEIPAKAEEKIARIRQCLCDLLVVLPSALAAVHEAWRAPSTGPPCWPGPGPLEDGRREPGTGRPGGR